MVAIGIDLGTTYSVTAWVNWAGDAEVIPDDAGQVLTPSVVSYASGSPVVGAEAKADQARGESDVAAYFKRNMGDPDFRLPVGGRDRSPTELSSLVLSHLKAQAEAGLGEPVERAVITVPEYFTHRQRQATLEAGERAGLQVPRIISEPTAAALAYGLRPGAAGGSLLVYDLGGGTFDVSLVKVSDEELVVVAAAGNHKLGGRDWDDRLAVLVQQKLTEAGLEVPEEEFGSLLVEVERLKHTLSARQSAEFRFTAAGRTARCAVTRAEFDQTSVDLVEQTAQLCEQVLRDAGLDWSRIDGVLPVGGSTRMPMVRDFLAHRSGRSPAGGIHPDHAVALGAAVQMALLPKPLLLPGAKPQPELRLPAPRRIQDVVPHSLGMIAESADRSRYLNSILLRRNLPVPCQESRPYKFRLRGDGNDHLEVFLTQAESDDPATCAYVGRYLVDGFPSNARGDVVVDVAYAYDENAMVTVMATERATGARLRVRVEELPPEVPDRFLLPPPVQLEREQLTVYLAFDLSGSMSGEPLEEAQRAAHAFVEQLDLSSTAVGLIAFSDRVAVPCSATQDANQIGTAIDGLDVGSTGWGNATHPFEELYRRLHTVNGRRCAVVLADGVWSRQGKAVEKARQCHGDDIDIVAIGFGYADKDFLDKIASSTEQALFTNLGGLSEAFSTIARELTEGGAGSRGLRLRS